MSDVLRPCGSCRRHVRASEPSCPFCFDPLRRSPVLREAFRSRVLGAALGVGALAMGCESASPEAPAAELAPPEPPALPMMEPLDPHALAEEANEEEVESEALEAVVPEEVVEAAPPPRPRPRQRVRPPAPEPPRERPPVPAYGGPSGPMDVFDF